VIESIKSHKLNPGDGRLDFAKHRIVRQLRNIFVAVLLFSAILVFADSLLEAKSVAELVNQEYLHIWRTDRIRYDFEFDGQPISTQAVIRQSFQKIVLLWILFAMLVATAFLLYKIGRRPPALVK